MIAIRHRVARLLFIVTLVGWGGSAWALPIGSSVEHGQEFLAAAWDGEGYDDEYLQFVYPGERLECPLPDCRLTYRLLDAFINLSLLERAGLENGPMTAQIARGRAVLEGLLPGWRETGVYNVVRRPDPDGIALDTYCIAGLLHEDQAMADVVSGHLGSDGWLAEDYYEKHESFRRLADESWCVRLLRFASPPGRSRIAPLARSLVEQADRFLKSNPRIEHRVNVALHLVYLLRELGDPRFAPELLRMLAVLEQAAGDPRIESDLLTQANLLEALAGIPEADEPLLRVVARRLTRNQQPDGGWYSRIGESGSSLRVFTTMRAVLALSRYERRSLREVRRRPTAEPRSLALVP